MSSSDKKSSTASSSSAKSANSPTKSLPTKNSVIKKPPPPGPKYITSPTPITVHIVDHKDASKSKSIVLTLPEKTTHAVAEIKRLVAKSTGIKPIDQRLIIDGAIDNFSLPLSVKLFPRTPSRQLTQSIIIRTFKETENNEVYSLTIDPSDTIIDIKFLLEPLLSLPAEYIRLYYKYPGQPTRTLLNNDGKSIKEYQIPNKAILKVLFEYPSFTVGHGPSHRSAIQFTQSSASNCRTVGEQFRFIANKCAKKPFLGTRTIVNEEKKIRGDYQWLSYEQVGNRVSALGAGLRVIGAKKGDCIGIMSNNRSEWIISDYSCACQGFISVPLYDTLGPDAVEFIINHSAIKIVIVNYQQLKAITAIKNKCPSLTHIIIMDEFAFEKKAIAALKDKENIMPFSQVEEIGKKNIDKYPDNMPSPDDLYTLSYTSGTTGNPKGAMIKHSAIISAAASMDERMPSEIRGENEVTFSYLPLAHIYERVLQIGVINKGYATGFSQGDTTKLVEDVAALRPTFFPGVPRVWQRVYDRILAQIEDSNIIRRTLFGKAMDAKLSMLHQGDTSPIIWDKIVFSKLAERFGGRLKCMSTGAAPLSHTIAEFMRCAFQAYFVEGYGMTETCAAISVTSVDDCIYGVVGTPQSCCEIKLVDVPDMEYYSANNVGEIWVRGPQLFSGYYKQADVTAETLTSDGWLATGDIGCWLEDGSLKIIDRKKNLFKLAQGEYISPEKIESVYKQVVLLQSIYVHGDSTETYCVAIGVPEAEGVKHWAEHHGMKDKSIADIIKSPLFIDALHKQMEEAAKKEQLRGFEIVKRIHLSIEDFTVEAGLMTPTFKLRRHAIAEKYAKQIEEMYKAGEPNAAGGAAIKAKL